MEELDLLIQGAADGDLKAFERLVARFQDMALGCAFAVLEDFGMAEDGQLLLAGSVAGRGKARVWVVHSRLT